jgi:hypothetical protein
MGEIAPPFTRKVLRRAVLKAIANKTVHGKEANYGGWGIHTNGELNISHAGTFIKMLI